MTITIECLGASREVGRSAFLIETDRRFIADYGMKIFDQSGMPTYPAMTDLNLDFAILSHAHMDHSGAWPALYNRNANSNIRWYATPPTKDICELLWKDSMKIMGDGLPYELNDFKRALKNFASLPYKQRLTMGNTNISMTDAGHISGSAMTEIEYQDKVLLYTGDLKCEETFMHSGAKFVKDVDYLIIEETYALKEHPPRIEAEHKLMDHVEETIDNGGQALFPAFALGRTQELISLIRHYNKDVNIFVDGMGKDMSRIYVKHPSYIKDADKFRKQLNTVRIVDGMRDKKEAVAEPGVIISTAGMLNGGPMLNYLFNAHPKSKVIFTGYCVEGTNGALLQKNGCILKDEQ